MFGIGSTELLIILVVALIVLGPKSLANVARSLGKLVGEFRRVSTDFQRTLNVETAEEDLRQAEEKRRSSQKTSVDGTSGASFPNSSVSQTRGTEANGHGEAGKAGRAPVDAKRSDNPQSIDGLPPDSPVAKAILNARMEAERNSQK